MEPLSESREWKKQLKETELAGRRSQYANLDFELSTLEEADERFAIVSKRRAEALAEIERLEREIRDLG